MLFKTNSHTELNVTLHSENTLQILLKATRFPKDDHYLRSLFGFVGFFFLFWITEVIGAWKESTSNFLPKFQTIATKKLSIECNNLQCNKKVC